MARSIGVRSLLGGVLAAVLLATSSAAADPGCEPVALGGDPPGLYLLNLSATCAVDQVDGYRTFARMQRDDGAELLLLIEAPLYGFDTTLAGSIVGGLIRDGYYDGHPYQVLSDGAPAASD